MIGRLLERLFVEVRADLSTLSTELAEGVRMTAASTGKMVKDWGKVENSLEQYKAEIATLSSQMAREAQAAGRAMTPLRRGFRGTFNPKPVNEFNRSVGMARSQMLNLGFQVNDIASGLATGVQNPFTIMVQQGSQIAQIYAGQGGVKTAFRDISNILVQVGKRLWPLAVMAAGFGVLQREINKTTDVGVTFMDTLTAVFQVTGRAIMQYLGPPLGWLKRQFEAVLDFIGEWFPKVMNGIIGVVISAVRIIGAVWAKLPDLFHDTWVAIQNGAIGFAEWFIDLFRITIPDALIAGTNKIIQANVFAFRAIGVVWKNLPAVIGDAMGATVNKFVDGAENMINGALGALQKLIDELNSFIDFVGGDAALEFFGFDGKIPPLGKADLQDFKMKTGASLSDAAAEIAATATKTFNENFLPGYTSASPTALDGRAVGRNAFSSLGADIEAILSDAFSKDYAGEFFEAIRAQAIENALKRIADGMEDVGGAAKKVKEQIDEVMKTLDEKLTEAADNLAGVFGSAFERLAETGKLTFGSFIKDMNSLIIKSTSEILQAELSNMFKSLAVSQGGLGGIFSNIFTGLFGGGKVGAFARGGLSMPGNAFIAGEEGPELITSDGPSGARRIHTAGQTRNMLQGGGQTNKITFNIQTPDAASFMKSQSQIARRAGAFIGKGRRNS